MEPVCRELTGCRWVPSQDSASLSAPGRPPRRIAAEKTVAMSLSRVLSRLQLPRTTCRCISPRSASIPSPDPHPPEGRNVTGSAWESDLSRSAGVSEARARRRNPDGTPGHRLAGIAGLGSWRKRVGVELSDVTPRLVVRRRCSPRPIPTGTNGTQPVQSALFGFYTAAS